MKTPKSIYSHFRIEPKIKKKAKELKINVSQTCRAAIAKEIKRIKRGLEKAA